MDTDQFRKDLKSLEDDEAGMVWQKTHDHNTQVTIAGVTYARLVNILAPYTVTFEDGAYRVILEGSNNNIFDEGILNLNQVQVIPTNSAGLQIVTQGSGVTEQDKNDIADKVLREPVADHDSVSGSLAEIISEIVGLGQKHKVIDDTSFDGNNNMTSCTVRIFPTKALADASTDGGTGEGETFRYNVVATYDGNSNLTDYKATRVFPT